jgi:hypothetical protein
MKHCVLSSVNSLIQFGIIRIVSAVDEIYSQSMYKKGDKTGYSNYRDMILIALIQNLVQYYSLKFNSTTLPPSVSRLSRQNLAASTSHNPMGLHGLLQG